MAKQDISVSALVDKVKSGELTLPEMQRRYVWKAVRVRDLLDSLYRGYPSGAILVWETTDSQNDRPLQIKGVSKSSFSGKLLLLDGQQRLTSLTAILSGEPVTVRNKKKPIDILFNLEHPDSLAEQLYETEVDDDDDDEDDEEDDILEEMRKKTFIVSSKRLKNDPNWISVTEIFKKTDNQLLKPLKINSDDPRWEKYTERMQKVRAIRNYPYVMEILDKNLTYEEVTEIFVRVNSLGAKLRGSDLALAQITSRWKGFMTEVEKFAAQHKNNEDYFHETGILIKLIVAFATGQSKFKTVNRIPLSELENSWKKAKKGIDFAVNFLKTKVQIENLGLLSSPFLLVPIAVYAVGKNERLSEREVNDLLLWFYVAHMKGRYSHGSTEGFLDIDLSALKKSNGLKELLSQLKFHVKDFSITEEEIAGKSRRSPLFSMLFFILKQKGVQDWFTGLGIHERHQGRSHALQFHHIFPKALLKAKAHDRRIINEMANLAFIEGRTNQKISKGDPEVYLPDIIKKQGNKTLAAQFVPNNPTLWKLSNYEKFVEYRRKEIVAAINSFINDLK